MRRMLVVVLTVGLVVAGAGSAPADVTRIDTCSAYGSFQCEASGGVRHPRRILMEATSRHRETGYDVDWHTVCFKWSGHERRRGSFHMRTPFQRQIPMAYWRPRRCVVEVSIFGGFDCCGHTKLVLRARV